MYKFNTIEEALEDIKAGKMVIAIDDEDRENEGDMMMAAEMVTPEAINFMAAHARGLICMPITRKRAEELELNYMVEKNTDNHCTGFTVSVDGPKSTTGISAFERSETVHAIMAPDTKAGDLKRPGHIFPLIAKEGGVLKRTGHTEAAVDLASLAGLYPAGVICEVMNEDGTMARVDSLMDKAKQHGLKIITVAAIIEYRRHLEKLVKKETEAKLPTKYGNFTIHSYCNDLDDSTHVALTMGDLSGDEPVLVRVHSECLTGDVFGSLRCDCGDQLVAAQQMIAKEGRGVLLYMRQEGRGIGLANKIKAYELQDQGKDTVEANIILGFPPDMRDYGIGAQILADLGLHKIRLITNNPKKIKGLEGYGLEVVDRVNLETPFNTYNAFYMETKKRKMGHILK